MELLHVIHFKVVLNLLASAGVLLLPTCLAESREREKSAKCHQLGVFEVSHIVIINYQLALSGYEF